MSFSAPLPRGAAAWSAASLAAVLVLVGVVRAKEHDPVAIEPDAPRAQGVEVATFALG